MLFQPSSYSVHRNPSDELFDSTTQTSNAGADYTALLEAAGKIGGAVVSTVAAGKQAKSAAKYERRKAKSQAALLEAQAKAAQAQAALTKSQAGLQSIGTAKILLIVGGLVATIGIVGTVVVKMKQGKIEGELPERDVA